MTSMCAQPHCTDSMHEVSSVSINVSCPHDSGKAGTGAEAPATTPPTMQSPRLYYIDWIRALIIALVVAFHSIDLYFNYTYSTAVYLGIVSDAPEGYSRQVAIVFAQLMQSWFMGLMFLLSGFFSAPIYDRKGALRFLADRALRLLLPLLVYDCVIQPLAFEIARHSPSAPAALLAAHDGFTYYYSTQFVRIGHGVSWYLAVLFIFDLLYAAARVCASGRGCAVAAAGSSLQSASGSARSTSLQQDAIGAAPTRVDMQHDEGCRSPYSTRFTVVTPAAPYDKAAEQLVLPLTMPRPVDAALQEPSTTSSGQHQPQPAFSAFATAAGLVCMGALISGLCLAVRAGILLPLGLQQSMWVVQGIQFQPAYLPQYFVAFLMGLAAFRAGNGLQHLPSSAGPVGAVAAAVLAVAGGVIMSHFPGSNFGVELQREASMAYVIVYTVWEQFYAVTMWLAVLVCFRRWVNSKGGSVGGAITGAAYAVYLIHVPVLTAIGLAFAPVAWPAAAKCVVVTPLVVVSSWLVGLLLRLLPGVRRVL